MPADVGNLAATCLPARPCGYHRLAGDASFTVYDAVCGHGASSPRIEGAYDCPRIGVMLGGAFHARTSAGSVVVGPGALLLGHAGAGYEYRHLDDGGDRSVVFKYDPALLDELGGLRAASVPAAASSARVVALTYEAVCTGAPDALREAALAVADLAIAHGVTSSAPPSAHARRIAQVLRYIEAHPADDCSLDALAALARLSSFHFVRTFRAVTGQTPRQIVIATRLRAAAARLRATNQPIAEIALDVGFGDLSHFMASFARAFGRSPGAYRRVTA